MKTITPFGYLNTDWFSGAGQWFGWGDQQVETPESVTPPQPPGVMTPPDGRVPAWERNGRNPQPLPPPENFGPSAETSIDPYAVVNEVQYPQQYSFLDQPGASDALVAFGAAMLKAPDFNTGLGDAALAVNRVAQAQRMPTEADYARAKQLGILSRLQRGDAAKPAKYNSMEMGYAPLGPNGEMVPVPAYLDPEQGYFYQMPDGTATTTPPPGFVRASDSSVGPANQYRTKEQEELQSKVAAEVRSANLSLGNYRQMLSMVDTAGVGSDFRTRISAEIARLGGYDFNGIDVSDQAVFNQKVKELNIDFAQKLQGQGQITEFERQIIAESLPQAGMNADAAKRVLTVLITGAERKQTMWKKWNMSPGLREAYNNRYEIYEAEYLAEVDAAQRGGGGAPSGGSGGKQKSLDEHFR